MKIIFLVLLLLCASVSGAFAQSGAMPPSADSAEKVTTFLRTPITSSQVISLASPFKIAVTAGDGKKIKAIVTTTGYTILTIDVISPTTSSPIEEFVCSAVVGDSLTLTARAQGTNPLIANNLTKHNWPVNSTVSWRVTGGMFKWFQWQLDTVWAHGGGTGSVTSVGVSGGTTGLTTSGGPITTAGTITLAGTLAVANGGTGQVTANAALNALLPSQASANGLVLGSNGTNTSWVANGVGTVTSFSSGNLSPLFTTSVSNSTTTPALSFSLSNAAQNAFLAGPTSGTGAPTYRAIAISDLPASIPNSSLANSSITVSAGTGISVSGSPVSLGGTVTITNNGYASPLTTLGDMLYENATPANARLAGNTTATKQFLSQTGNGTISAAPAWATIQASDLPGSFSGFANPTASIGLSAVNGSATTAMRSDAAPSLDVSIAPTWTGLHTFNVTNATTNAVDNIITIDHNSSGTVAANFGEAIAFNLQSSTTANRNAGLEKVYWSTATDASRVATYKLQLANNTALADVLTITGAGNGTFAGTLGASNLSGTNTGDQTITLTSDVTGSGTGSFATTIANLAVTNAKIANSTIDLTAKVTGTLPVVNGGTGLATLTNHSLQVGAGTSTPTQIAVPASGTLLTGVASSDPAFSATPTLGVAGTTTGQLKFANATGSNVITLAAPASPSAYTFTLPTSGGTNAYVLQTDGSGVTSWVAQSGGGSFSLPSNVSQNIAANTAADGLQMYNSNAATNNNQMYSPQLRLTGFGWGTTNSTSHQEDWAIYTVPIQGGTQANSQLTFAARVNSRAWMVPMTLDTIGTLNLITGGSFQINGTSVLSATTLGSGVTASSLTSLGTITTGVWNGTVLTEAYGGTHQSSYTTGDINYASATNTLSKLAIASNTNLLTITGGVPAWEAIPTWNQNTTGTSSAFTGNLTGDVTSIAMATTIASNAVTTSKINNAAVTLAKIANAGANSVLVGSGSAGTGTAYSEVTLGGGLSMSGTVLSRSTSSGANPTATIGTSAVNGSAATFMRSDAAPAFGNLTGNVTSVGMATTIANLAVTNAMIAASTIDLTAKVTGVLPIANGGTGTATAFTLGSAIFAGASGVYTQDNANYFYDVTNHDLLLGTNSTAKEFPRSPLTLYGSTNNYMQATLQNGSGGAAASGDFIIACDTATDTTGYLDIGVNSSGYVQSAYDITRKSGSYIYSQLSSLAIFTATNDSLIFGTGGSRYSNRRMSIDGSGIVTIQGLGAGAVSASSSGVLSSGILSIANGGTNATTANGAFKNLTADSTAKTGYAYTVLAGGGYGWAASGGGSGTVTSVALTVPGVIFTSPVSGSPITTSGTLALALATQSKNTFLAGPTSGSAATPTFRTVGSSDVPHALIWRIFGGGSGAVIVTGVPADSGINVSGVNAGTITSWEIISPLSGSIVVDILNAGASIIGSGNKPTLTSATEAHANANGSWTSTTVSQYEPFTISVSSVTSIQSCILILYYQ